MTQKTRSTGATRVSASPDAPPSQPGFFTFDECRAYAQAVGIRSSKAWLLLRRHDRNPRAPSNPQNTYRAEWQGWTHFLGGTRRQRPPGSTQASYAEARAYGRALGCASTTEWMAMSRKGLHPHSIPTSPNVVYKGEFTGWSDFLGHAEWWPYEDFRSYVRNTLKITTHTAWKGLGRDKLDPRAPSHPDRVYKETGWRGWPELFGTRRHSTASQQRGKSLAERFPDIAAEWHPTRNGALTPRDVAPLSSTNVWWMCKESPAHEWQGPPKTRTDRSAGMGGCPTCASTSAAANSLAMRFPGIAAEVHPDFELTAHQIASGSSRKVRWRCSVVPAHEWEATAANRTGAGTGCPHCTGRRVSPTNNLAVLNPDIAREWHPTKNTTVPARVLPGSHDVAWWVCPNGHAFPRAIRLRVRGDECPQCAKRVASPTYNLAALRPDLAREWHPTKNRELKPENVTPRSKQQVWWRCGAGHEWLAVVGNRLIWGGCPDCGSRWTVNNIRSFVLSLTPHLKSLTPSERWLIFQQSGALRMDGARRQEFIRGLATGTFPQDEVDKFAGGQSSSIDKFFSGTQPEDEAESRERPFDDGEVDKVVSVDDLGKEPDMGALPNVSVSGILDALKAAAVHASDPEAIEFLVASGKAKLWTKVFTEGVDAVSEARGILGNGYAESVRADFLREYDAAMSLPVPEGYAFRRPGSLDITQPNLMQRLVASRIQRERRIGNWSGTGSGKTNSAILASRIIGAKQTVICCPNSVVTGWESAILTMFPDSTVRAKTWAPTWDRSAQHRYLVLNYELFQQRGVERHLGELYERDPVDFVVIDEIHFVKQRSEDVSRRREMVGSMITSAAQRNGDLCVLGMSATPAINTLREPVALIEMVTGEKHDDLDTRPTVANCMRVFQRLTTLGPRWRMQHTTGFEQREVRVDCSPFVDEIRSLGRHGTPLQLEEILTRARLPAILDAIVPKTLIYTHYIGGTDRLDRQLREAIVERGWRTGFFTGEEKSGLEAFVGGDLDVLIASSAISTGVDGLQQVCNRLVINVLPWTAAEFEQLIGRIHRQGQTRPVTLVIPVTYAEVSGQEWSWCKAKMQRLRFKKSVADAAVDGIVPEGHLRSPEKAYQDLMAWLERLSSGEVEAIQRPAMTFATGAPTETFEIRQGHFGDFSRMNARWNGANSSTTHERLERDPGEWRHYHEELARVRGAWPADPQEEFIRWAQRRTDLAIGDFGCGRARVASALADRHLVHSFDHVAVNENVVACDMAHVPLEVDVLDVALFCLSMMGSNATDYLHEAYRTLKLDGWLHVYEPTGRFSDKEAFVRGLRDLGFGNVEARDVGKFTHVSARKTEHVPQADAALQGLGS